MRIPIVAAVLTAIALTAIPVAAEASRIENACVRSDRAAATRARCACVQRVANQHLTRADQRQASRFFRDPDRAHQVRFSRDERDRAFWQRYRAFADAAETLCR